MGEIGHNSDVGGIAADRLRSIVERIERLEEEKRALASDIKDVYAEAKSAGFDVKTLRHVVALRRRDPGDVEEMEAMLTLYRRALGMLADTPLGAAAIARHEARQALRTLRATPETQKPTA